MSRRRDNDDLLASQPAELPTDVQAADYSGELTEEDKLKLEKQARREVAEAIKKSKAEAFKEAAKNRILLEKARQDGKDDKGEDLVTVDLHLASYPPQIVLDGKVYYSGKKYKVNRGKAQVLLELMYRGWEAEERRLDPAEKGRIRQGRRFHLQESGQAVLQEAIYA